jgi:hypothetical protein
VFAGGSAHEERVVWCSGMVSGGFGVIGDGTVGGGRSSLLRGLAGGPGA